MATWITKLQPGDALKIMKCDWNKKRAPFYIAKKNCLEFIEGRLLGIDGSMIFRVK